MLINELPERISHLILLFLHVQLSDIQRKELDRWILLNEQHEIIFDKAITLPSKKQKEKVKAKKSQDMNDFDNEVRQELFKQ